MSESKIGRSCAIASLVVLPMSARTRVSLQDPRATPDISGFWELSFDSRNVPRANLLPAITRAKLDAHAKKDAYAIRWCNLLGVPFVMSSAIILRYPAAPTCLNASQTFSARKAREFCGP